MVEHEDVTSGRPHITPEPSTAADIDRAAQTIRQGDLVAFPTETVYGLGADAANDEAVARIFKAKGRPRFNPLIVHVAGIGQAQEHGAFSKKAEILAGAFWPGALTLVVHRRDDSPLSLLVSAGLDTVALRAPAHDVAQGLIAAAGRPIAAPSANRSGHISPTEAEHVADDLGSAVAVILDGGSCPVGLESTIVGFVEGKPVLLRPGGISTKAIEDVLCETLTMPPDRSRPDAPGQLESHYAPRARLRLNAKTPEPGEMMLAFGPDAPAGVPGLNLSSTGNLVEAAANLFAYLRILDETGADAIAVMPVPDDGLGEAINDRLKRAAAPR